MSTQPRSGTRRRVRRGRTSVLLLAVLLATLLTAPPASAYWTGSGSGSGSAPTGTLAPPTNVTAPPDTIRDVPVSWTESSGVLEPTGYYVTRHTGEDTAPACASSPTVLLPGSSCTDTGAADGEHTYVVTAVFRSWTATSAPSPAVVVVNPTQLLFATQPTDVETNATIAPPVTVTLGAQDGTLLPLAGVTITMAIGTNPGAGVLLGTQSAQTDASGVATFADLSIDQPGTGYTLQASSPGLTSATSAEFDVLVPPLLGRASR